MALNVPEDAYADVSEADAYWSNRNNSDWSAAATADKEAALRFASDFIDGQYAGRWIGEHPGSNSQVRAWPRNSAEDFEGRIWTGVPPFLKNATIRLALDLLNDFPETVQDRGGMVKREQVGSLEVEYMDGAPSGRSYPYLDTILAPLLSSRGGVRYLTRV